jgi:hypothetical protein
MAFSGSDDFGVVGVLYLPAEADAPLVVDADAVLTAAVALQRFESVAGRQTHDLKPVGGGELERVRGAVLRPRAGRSSRGRELKPA